MQVYLRVLLQYTIVLSKKGVSPSGDLTIERVLLYSINMAFTISVGIQYIIMISVHDLLNQNPVKSL